MDKCEAIKIVFSRIQSLDPDNASKTMSFILLHDPDEDIIIRIALGTDTQLLSLINHAKTHLGLSSNTLPVLPNSSDRTTIPNNDSHLNPPPSSSISHIINVVNGNTSGVISTSSSPSTLSSSFPPTPFYSTNIYHPQIQQQLSFVEDSMSSNNVDFSDWKPCIYYARGSCKYGSKCKFMHGSSDDSSQMHFPGRMEAIIQHQRLISGKYGINCNLNDSPRFGAAAATSFMMEEDFHKFGKYPSERLDFLAMGMDGIANSISRQIYLTFPEDSTFKEDDVSAYFSSKFGPVQDVRIPYQKKRMFGFVTFVHPETVKIILEKGNPHFVCNSRVLVKPYKEKERNSDKNQPDYLHCLSPSAHDFPIGGRMVYDPQEILFRRKLEEQAELQQQAIELHRRRLMNLHLMCPQFNSNLSPLIPISHSLPNLHIMNQPLTFRHDPHFNKDKMEENDTSLAAVGSPPKEDDQQTQSVLKEAKIYDNANGRKQPSYIEEDESLPESMKYILPDNLFSSPTKASEENNSSMF